VDKQARNQVEVGHARPQIVGATLAPAIPASKDGASARIKLYLQIEATTGMDARQTGNLSQPCPCRKQDVDSA
jgi:hypothetical protein